MGGHSRWLFEQGESDMSMPVTGIYSPYDVIAFVQQHTEECSKMVKSEMQAAQDRTQLVRDIADLTSALEDAKNRADWHKARVLTAEFMTKHPETWGGRSMDLIEAYCNMKAWDEGHVIAANTYSQVNYPDGSNWGESFHSEWVNAEANDDTKPAQQSMLAGWIKRLDDWKDQTTSDDKISMMTLEADADHMKNLYETGSALVAKTDQTMSTIIGNIGRG
jgi:hypothetical protein